MKLTIKMALAMLLVSFVAANAHALTVALDFDVHIDTKRLDASTTVAENIDFTYTVEFDLTTITGSSTSILGIPIETTMFGGTAPTTSFTSEFGLGAAVTGDAASGGISRWGTPVLAENLLFAKTASFAGGESYHRGLTRTATGFSFADIKVLTQPELHTYLLSIVGTGGFMFEETYFGELSPSGTAWLPSFGYSGTATLASVAPVPLPSSLALAIGCVGFIFFRPATTRTNKNTTQSDLS